MCFSFVFLHTQWPTLCTPACTSPTPNHGHKPTCAGPKVKETGFQPEEKGTTYREPSKDPDRRVTEGRAPKLREPRWIFAAEGGRNRNPVKQFSSIGVLIMRVHREVFVRRLQHADKKRREKEGE